MSWIAAAYFSIGKQAFSVWVTSLTMMLCTSVTSAVNAYKPQRPLQAHNTNTLENVAHAAPAYSCWISPAWSSVLSFFCRRNNKQSFLWFHTVRFSSFHQPQLWSTEREIHYNCRHRQLFLFFFVRAVWRWMSPNLLVKRTVTSASQWAYLLRKLKSVCRGAAASLS